MSLKACGWIVILVPIALTACKPGVAPGGVVTQGATFRLESGDAAYAGESSLHAYFWASSETHVQFSFSVSDGDHRIGFVSYLPTEVLTSRRATVGVTYGPIGLGLANMSANDMPNAPGFDGAAVSMTFDRGTVTGAITPVEDQRWTFGGKLAVGCWVPASALPAPPAGGIVDGGSSGSVVPDEKLETAQCQPLKGLWAP